MKKYSVVIDGRTAYYWVLNPRRQNTIVMIHGYRGNHRGLLWLAKKLPEHRLVMVDLPGYGESAPMRAVHTFKNYSAWLEKFFAKLLLQNFYLLGHSYGASICIDYAAYAPKRIKKLILISPVQESKTFVAYLGRAYYSLALHMPRYVRHHWLVQPAFDWISRQLLIKVAKGQKKRELVEQGKQNLLELIDRVVIEGYLDLKNNDFYKTAKQITLPTLIIGGQKDQIAPVKTEKKFNKIIKNSKLIILPHVGHLSPLELPQSVASHIDKFLGT